MPDIWDLYHSGSDADFRAHLSSSEDVKRTPRWANNVKSLIEMGGFDDEDAVRNFMNFVSDPYVGDHWLAEAIAGASISAPSPFGEGNIFCKESHYAGVNKLFFRSESGEKVIIFQSITSVDIVCFPSRDIFISMKHPPVPALEDYFTKFSEFAPNLPTVPAECFGGVLISHFYPFHFYSESIPAFERIHAKGMLKDVPQVLYRNGGAFFNPKLIWPEIKSEFGFEARDASKIMRNKLFLLHGTVFEQNNHEQMVHAENAYRKALARSVSSVRDSEKFSEFIKVSSARTVLWFGVQATKRSWLEQVDGIASIINSSRKLWPDLVIVLDGWTSPTVHRAADKEPIASDLAIVQEILSRIPETPHVITVGWNSMDKLAIASQVDAFVTNYGTGSLHVARIAQRPGVGHINTVLEKEFHVHYHTKCLSTGVVTDNPADLGKRADAVSYSFDWKIAFSALREILEARAGRQN